MVRPTVILDRVCREEDFRKEGRFPDQSLIHLGEVPSWTDHKSRIDWVKGSFHGRVVKLVGWIAVILSIQLVLGRALSKATLQ